MYQYMQINRRMNIPVPNEGRYFGKYVIAIYCIIYTKILRYIVLLYVIWMYYDNDTHDVTGKR
ncbi:hypothetical protein E2986_14057 [Frieseomelitta varia]|uniref:Uncharacterized protein n=1 Tax=Frieseomelitta varia TaxID=561572 RepID=A0A833RV05_9HYME|nr:hypothetical protein E2986_14057 [Frieseomelitta varia]